MTANTQDAVVMAAFLPEVEEATDTPRKHTAGDLEALATLASDFAHGDVLDPEADGGVRDAQVVVWYDAHGAVCVIDDETSRDTVTCLLRPSEQMRALRLLSVMFHDSEPLSGAQMLRLLAQKLSGCVGAGEITKRVREPGLEGWAAGFGIDVPFWAQYGTLVQMQLYVEKIEGYDAYLIAPMAGEMDRLERMAAATVYNRITDRLAQLESMDRVSIYHGRP